MTAVASSDNPVEKTAEAPLAFLAGAPGIGPGALRREHSRLVGELLALQSERRWADIIALLHPLDEKAPELVAAGMDGDLRTKIAFALVREKKSDEALSLLTPLAERLPEDAMVHYTIGYAVLDVLFTARTERRILPARKKQQLIALGHTHLARAQLLRPDSVTFFYREAILFKEVEDKPKSAIVLFERAIANWERQNPGEQERHHQQRPKYVKSLYHLAACLLTIGQPARSLTLLKKLEAEDRNRNFMHPLFWHFAFGKVLHALRRHAEAMQHLETAGRAADSGQPTDFVWELAARCALALGQPEQAGAFIARIPRTKRRPYVVWTEADVLAASGRARDALSLLRGSAERDKRSRHISLIRMARILLGLKEGAQALEAATLAVQFCRDTFGNPSKEALFWKAAALHLLDRNQEALAVIMDLEAGYFQYPHFDRLAGLIRNALKKDPAPAQSASSHGGGEPHAAAAINQ